MNTLIDTVKDLCWENDRLGFINGFKMGMRLEQELSQYPKQHAALPPPASLRVVLDTNLFKI